MMQLTEWFSMHGYAAYIWPSYALVFTVLIFNIVHIRKRTKYIRNLLRTIRKGS